MAVAVVAIAFIAFSIVVLSQKTYSVSVAGSGYPAFFASGLNTHQHYNVQLGYVNFTEGQTSISFFYYTFPFMGVGPNVSVTITTQLSLLQFTIFELSYMKPGASASINRSVPIQVRNISLVSPQDPDLAQLVRIKNEGTYGENSLWIDLEPLSPYGLVTVLSPGFHNIYLNFTLSMYNTFGPYKFPCQSKTVHLEYNNTIVE